MATTKEANTLKDVNAESDTDLHETIEQFEPPDPTVSTMKEKNSGLMKTHDRPRQAHAVKIKAFESA